MTEDTTQASPVRRLEIDWLKMAAGALAAVSSAVLLSTLGAAGTIIGAALGSVVVTLASAFYSQGLERSRQRLVRAQSLGSQRVGGRDGSRRDPGPRSDDRLPAAPPTSWHTRLARLSWRHVALVAAVLFVVAVLLITSFELLAGRSVASFTGGTSGSGGTSITRLGGSGGDSGPTPAPHESTSPTAEPSSRPSPSDGSSVPSEGEPSPSAPAPTEPSTPEPSLTPPTTPPPVAPSGTPAGPASAVPSS